MTAYLNFHTVAAGLNALVLGGMVLLTFVVAPTVFRILDRDLAGALMGAVFRLALPVFAAASIGAALLLFYRFDAVLLGANGAIFLLSWMGLVPLVESLRAARAAGEAGAARRFRLLHGASQLLNLGQLALSAFVFFRLAA